MTAPIDAFNNWFQRKFGRSAPAPDGGAGLTLALAAPLVDAGFTAGTQDASSRATRLAIGMTNFRQPGTVTSPTYFTMWHAALMDAAGVDPDAEWLVSLNERVVAKDWVGALAMVKGRVTSASAPRGDITLSGFLLPILGAEAVSKLRVAMSA